MALNTAALNSLDSSFATLAPFISLHSADPGTNGTSPTSAARLAAGWSAPSNGVITASNLAFTGGAANGAVTHIGFWSASTGGTFYGSAALAGDNTFNSSGQYTVTSITVTAS